MKTDQFRAKCTKTNKSIHPKTKLRTEICILTELTMEWGTGDCTKGRPGANEHGAVQLRREAHWKGTHKKKTPKTKIQKTQHPKKPRIPENQQEIKSDEQAKVEMTQRTKQHKCSIIKQHKESHPSPRQQSSQLFQPYNPYLTQAFFH